MLHAVYRVLRDLAGVGDLGVNRRGISFAGAIEGTERGVIIELDHECDYCGHLFVYRDEEPCSAVCILRGDDGGAVLHGVVYLSGDQAAIAGADSGGVRDWAGGGAWEKDRLVEAWMASGWVVA